MRAGGSPAASAGLRAQVERGQQPIVRRRLPKLGAVIHIEGLTKRYKKADRNAVDGISFDVRAGEFFALLGPNGAGKTTTISSLRRMPPENVRIGFPISSAMPSSPARLCTCARYAEGMRP